MTLHPLHLLFHLLSPFIISCGHVCLLFPFLPPTYFSLLDLHPIFLPIAPPPTPGHLLRDRLPGMCGGWPAVRHSDARRRALLLHVPLL